MDADLERSIAAVQAAHPGEIHRRDGVLTGWSRGGYAVAPVAAMHPNRWPFLVIIDADAPLSAARLREAGVRAVALVAAERGTALAGVTKSVQALTESGLAARLFVMRGAYHQYSPDIEAIMTDVFAFFAPFK